MILYIAGPMRGHPRFNFDKFDEVRERFAECGHTPISPADLDRLHGFDPDTRTEHDLTNEFIRGAFARDVLAIYQADGVVCLDGWEESTGAKAEVALALVLRLPIYDECGYRIFPHMDIPTYTIDELERILI